MDKEALVAVASSESFSKIEPKTRGHIHIFQDKIIVVTVVCSQEYQSHLVCSGRKPGIFTGACMCSDATCSYNALDACLHAGFTDMCLLG